MTIPELHLDDLNGRKVLISWSGGLDSTHLLFSVLSRTTAEVFTHNVLFEGIHPGERLMVKAQEKWLRDQGHEWTHTENRMEIPRDWHGMVSPPLMYMLAPLVALRATAIGLLSEDFILSGRNVGVDEPVGSEYERMLATIKENAVAGAYRFRRVYPPFTALNPPPTREQQSAELPAELRDLILYCDAPVSDPAAPSGLRACGECHSCNPAQSLPILLRHTVPAVLALKEQAARVRGGR